MVQQTPAIVHTQSISGLNGRQSEETDASVAGGSCDKAKADVAAGCCDKAAAAVAAGSCDEVPGSCDEGQNCANEAVAAAGDGSSWSLGARLPFAAMAMCGA